MNKINLFLAKKWDLGGIIIWAKVPDRLSYLTKIN